MDPTKAGEILPSPSGQCPEVNPHSYLPHYRFLPSVCASEQSDPVHIPLAPDAPLPNPNYLAVPAPQDRGRVGANLAHTAAGSGLQEEEGRGPKDHFRFRPRRRFHFFCYRD